MNRLFLTVLLVIIALNTFPQSTKKDSVQSDTFENRQLLLSKKFVKGKVTEKDNTPLPFATVAVFYGKKLQFGSAVAARANGEFIFTIPDSALSKKITIQVSSAGFQRKTIHINGKTLPISGVVIKLDHAKLVE